MSTSTLLMIVLLISADWRVADLAPQPDSAYYPSGGLGLVLLIVIVLLLMGAFKLHRRYGYSGLTSNNCPQVCASSGLPRTHPCEGVSVWWVELSVALQKFADFREEHIRAHGLHERIGDVARFRREFCLRRAPRQ